MLADLKLALRQLAKAPGFTAIAILSLAIALGAGTAVFSVVNAVLLRSLPVPNPQELFVLHWTGKQLHIPSWSGGDTSFTPPHYFRLREQAGGQADIFGYIPVENQIVRAGNELFSANGLVVSDNFFSGLQVKPLIGRTLLAGEDYAGSGVSVVISHACWERYFASQPEVLGRTIAVNGHPFSIVGVLPRGFGGPQAGKPADFYVALSTGSPFLYREITSNFHWYVRIMARLRPGSTEAQLKASLDLAWSSEAAEFMQAPRLRIEPGMTGETTDRSLYQKPLFLLLGVVAVVIFVACANLAGMSLARGAGRTHELAVRAALGAGRWRIVRQSLVESLLLALAGAALGVLIAGSLRVGVAQLLTGAQGELHYDFAFDHRVFGFALSTALLTAVLSGLLPALRASRASSVDGLKSRGTLGTPRLRTGRLLVAGQIALSMILLTGAGLYVRTLINMAGISSGFSTAELLLFRVNIQGSASANAQPAEFYAKVQERIARLPGVQSACLVEFPLLSGTNSSGGVHLTDGFGNPSEFSTSRLTVGEPFFATLGVPIVQGRGFVATDHAEAPKVVIVNEAFVRHLPPHENPIGLQFRMWDAKWQVVGVCRDLKYSRLREAAPPTTYFPFQQRFYGRFKHAHLRAPYFAVRTQLPALALTAAIRHALNELDPATAVGEFATQDDVRAQSIGQERLFALLCSGLAALAVLLACLGVYGLMAYNVSRRTGEFGIRLALGAQRTDVAWPILREALLLACIGAAVGLPASLAVTRLIESQLYGVQPNDPLTLVLVSGVLITITMFAASLPARRATRVNPIEALRAE